MSTLKTNNIQHVDRSDPSIIINTDGSVNIAGTMTYEDVTNVDAVGIITGRNNIDAQKQVLVGTGVSVKAGGLNVTAGITTVQALQATTGTFSSAVSGTTGTFTGDVDIADKIIHTGDTNTAIRFPSVDNISFETDGGERVRITSSMLGINTTSVSIAGMSRYLSVSARDVTNGGGAVEIVGNRTGSDQTLGVINFVNDASNVAQITAKYQGSTTSGSLQFLTSGSERVRIASDGQATFDKGAPGSSNQTIARFQAQSSRALDIVWHDSGSLMGFDTPGNHSYIFKTNGTERARLTSGGTFGVNTNGDPTERVHFEHDQNITVLAECNTSGSGKNAAYRLKSADSSADWYMQTGNVTSGGLRWYDGNAGAERFRIDSNGRLLVNNTSSTSPDGFDSLIQVNASNHEGSITIGRHTANANGPALLFQKSRSGTATPGTGVVSSGDVLGTIRFYASDGTDRNSFAANIGCEVDGTPGGNDMPGRLIFSTTADGSASSTERMRIDSNGKFFFGTYNAGYANNDSVANFINAASAGTENPLLTLWNPTTAGDARASIDFLTNNNSGTGRDGAFIRASNDGVTAKAHIQFGTIKDETYDETMRLTSGGALLINSTSQGSDELFKIFTDSTGPEMMQLRNNAASSTKDMITMMHVNNSGAVMIRFKQTGGLTNVGSITTSASATAYNTSSDYRLKENEVLISDGITRLKTLKPYRFNFKTEPDKTVDGFFAHEVTAVPEAVTGEKDAVETTYYAEGDTIPEGKAIGDIKEENVVLPQSLDYAKFTPLLTAALQEEVAKREALEVRIAAIEKIAGI